MSYIHCQTPGCLNQDDFYSPNGYSPANYLKEREELLFSNDPGKIEAYAEILEHFAKSVRCAVWVTRDDWQNSNNPRKCPICGTDVWED